LNEESDNVIIAALGRNLTGFCGSEEVQMQFTSLAGSARLQAIRHATGFDDGTNSATRKELKE
jgi:hypothetical protein